MSEGRCFPRAETRRRIGDHICYAYTLSRWRPASLNWSLSRFQSSANRTYVHEPRRRGLRQVARRSTRGTGAVSHPKLREWIGAQRRDQIARVERHLRRDHTANAKIRHQGGELTVEVGTSEPVCDRSPCVSRQSEMAVLMGKLFMLRRQQARATQRQMPPLGDRSRYSVLLRTSQSGCVYVEFFRPTKPVSGRPRVILHAGLTADRA
jgi:hypothetical protein